MTRRQLAAVGIGGSALTRRVAAGRLVRVYPGVYAVGHVPRTREARWIAAVMACGRGAVLSHLDAAALWQIYESRGTSIHVTSTSRSGRKLPGIRAHRVRQLDPADTTVKDGIHHAGRLMRPPAVGVLVDRRRTRQTPPPTRLLQLVLFFMLGAVVIAIAAPRD